MPGDASTGSRAQNKEARGNTTRPEYGHGGARGEVSWGVIIRISVNGIISYTEGTEGKCPTSLSPNGSSLIDDCACQSRFKNEMKLCCGAVCADGDSEMA